MKYINTVLNYYSLFNVCPSQTLLCDACQTPQSANNLTIWRTDDNEDITICINHHISNKKLAYKVHMRELTLCPNCIEMLKNQGFKIE